MGFESLARLVSRRLPSAGLLANLVEFPAVPKERARFRLQVMANHTNRDIVDAVHCLSKAAAAAKSEDDALRAGKISLAELEVQVVADLAGAPAHPLPAPAAAAEAAAQPPLAKAYG